MGTCFSSSHGKHAEHDPSNPPKVCKAVQTTQPIHIIPTHDYDPKLHILCDSSHHSHHSHHSHTPSQYSEKSKKSATSSSLLRSSRIFDVITPTEIDLYRLSVWKRQPFTFGSHSPKVIRSHPLDQDLSFGSGSART